MSNPENQGITSTVLDMYKTYLEDLSRIGARHETSRRFYLSLISALFVFLSMSGWTGVFQNVEGPVLAIVVIVGVLVCVAWFSHMRSFAWLCAAKLSALRELEGRLPAQPFGIETERLAQLTAHVRGRRTLGYMPMTLVDAILPFAFAVLLLGILLFRNTYSFRPY